MTGQVTNTLPPQSNVPLSCDEFEIAVTGIGIVSPLGLGCYENLERLQTGESAVKHEILPGFEACGAIPSGHCPDFDLSALLRTPKTLKYMSRPVQLAMRAAIEAVESSGLRRREIDPFRLAIYTASGQTGLDYKEFSRALEMAWGQDNESDFRHLGGIPTKLIDPYFSLRTLANGGIGLLSAEFNAKGPSSNFVHSEGAAALALQAACVDLTEGRSDAAIVGGFDSLLYPTALFAFSEAGILTGDATHFEQVVPSEGAAFFILERRQDAIDRDADILGELLAVECSIEAHGRNSGHSSGRGMRRLVSRLPESCRSVQFAVSPSAASHDNVANALSQAAACDPDSDSSPIVSTFAPLTGYLGAATSAVELALGLLSVRHGFVPSVLRRREAGADGMTTFDEPAAAIETPNPTGIFFSGSWSGHIAAIVARAVSAERKVSGACAP